jgi:hypothetical protein
MTKRKEAYLKNNNAKKIVFDQNHFIVVSVETVDCYLGYCLFTEEFKALKKTLAMNVSKSILRLIGDEAARVKMAIALSTTGIEASKLINVSPRTIYRTKAREL